MKVADGQELEVAACDVSIAFDRMRVPPSLGKRFAFPAIDAKNLGVPGHSGMIKPSLTVLPMGWAWALRLCQLVVENFVAREAGEEHLAKDGTAHAVVRRGVDIGAAYVDNVLIFSGAGKQATRRLNRGGGGLHVRRLVGARTQLGPEYGRFPGTSSEAERSQDLTRPHLAYQIRHRIHFETKAIRVTCSIARGHWARCLVNDGTV